VDKKVVGPAFKDVAAKYAGDAGAEAKLEQKIKSGGSGVWGPIPMPPNIIPDADLKALTAWVLAAK
jgi:cytochrome c